MMNRMPIINLEHLEVELSPEDFEIVKGIVATRGQNKGRLRTGRPALDINNGYTAYVWRMVAFYASPKGQHWCDPVMATAYLPWLDGCFGKRKKSLIVGLDAIVDAVLETIPKEQWHGVRRWGQVLGRVGTPGYNAESAVVYR